MGGNLACIAAVLLGVDVGWQPLPDGGVEYLIQIEPHMLETLKSGEPIASDIPTKLKDVRAYRITVGTNELPRALPPELPAAELPVLNPPKKDEVGSPKPSGPPSEIGEPDLSGPMAAPPPAIQPDLHSFSAPGTLSPAPNSQPITGQPAVLIKAVEVEEAVAKGAEPKPPLGTETSDPPGGEPRSKPWLLTLFGLFASLGGNVYLLWIAAGFRSRYYAVVRQSDGMPNA